FKGSVQELKIQTKENNIEHAIAHLLLKENV
ncbi:MAG: copper ABC transporter ATP-binding protein, partial [Flavobacteriales bacterium CG_4_10_14_0_2_um_filter_32_8]